jgi:2-amino-4-hydroxy-6-hydroxymethyldihydropteridine diphosphokinase
LAQREGIEVLDCSSVYETEAVDGAAGQRDFYNAVVKARTALPASALLAECKSIERELGREKGAMRHAPRSIDVDLLLLEDVELAEPELVLPHPEITSRRFVLVPLLELDPALELPDGRSLARALGAHGGGQRVTRVGILPAG